MNRELIIDSSLSEVNIALLEDKSLVELNKEQINNNFAVGDVFFGKGQKDNAWTQCSICGCWL